MVWQRCGLALLGVTGGLAALSVVAAQAVSPTPSKMSLPATAPATAPSDDSKEVTEVKRHSLKIVIDAEGWFEAIDPFEVRVRPKAYQGDLEIVRSAAPGAKVAAGDLLLEIKSDKLKQQLAAAENELAIAQANLAKAEADLKFGNEGDTLASKHQGIQLANAQKGLKWWDDNDSKVQTEMANFQVGLGEFFVESSQDELEELRKMYKAEDLASVTADLVIKRSMRILGLYKRQLGIMQGMAQRMLGFEIEVMREMMSNSLESMQLAAAQLQSSQAHGRIMRETSLVSARAAREKAQEKMDELKQDMEAMSVKAPIEGVLIYGAYNNQNWQETDRRQLQPGEKLQPNQIVMTVYQPGRLRVRMKLPEEKLFWFPSNATAKVTPAAAGDLVYEGSLGSPSLLGASEGPSQSFDIFVELPAVDQRFRPGYRAVVKIDAGAVENVAVVPVTSVARGRVWVREGEDKDTPRDVIVGKSDGALIEIKSGLSEGEKVLTQAKQ